MLAGTGSKIWKLTKRTNNKTRVNMGECNLLYRQTFFSDNILSDNDRENQNCGPSIEGIWNFTTGVDGNTYLKITSGSIPEIFSVKNNSKSKLFQVIHLSDSFFVYWFNHS